CSEAQKTNFTKECLQDELLSSSGTLISFEKILDQYQEKTIVIDVWASWCPDCIKGMPKVEQLQKENPEVVFLFLSYDKSPEKWKAGIEKYQVKGEHYLIQSAWKGGNFSKSIDLDWIPRYMVVKNKKIILYKAIEANDEKLINALK
ncbi:MAG: TlpA family protein disulfide reductase, partial [Flavobacterium sp.]